MGLEGSHVVLVSRYIVNIEDQYVGQNLPKVYILCRLLLICGHIENIHDIIYLHICHPYKADTVNNMSHIIWI